MKRVDKAFTLIELLTVIGIIALLLAIAMPAYNQVRIKAKEASTRAVINAVSSGLEMFNNEYGYYPDSGRVNYGGNPVSLTYSGAPGATLGTDGKVYNLTAVDLGANRLVEALLGADLLGHQKNSEYFINATDGTPVDKNGNPAKRDPYIESKNLNLTTLDKIYGMGNANYVIADSFSNEPGRQRPFLYFRANTRGTILTKGLWNQANRRGNGIYDFEDNSPIMGRGDSGNMADSEVFGSYNLAVKGSLKQFPFYVWDPRTSNNDINMPTARPYNKDSFLIITAGRDGEYGTEDDICNFDQNAGK